MNLDNFNATKDWAYYFSVIDASTDPLDFLMSAENIPYKKLNRIGVSAKNKKYPIKKPTLEGVVST